MTIKRQPSQQEEISESISKHELRNAFRSAGTKHRREARRSSCAKLQGTASITCHLCHYVFERPVSRNSDFWVCPACGVKFEMPVKDHADSIQVSKIEEELIRLRLEIEAQKSNRKENPAKSVIGPLPMHTVKKNRESGDHIGSQPENADYFSMTDRVNSSSGQLDSEQWDAYLQWRNSLNHQCDSQHSQNVSVNKKSYAEQVTVETSHPHRAAASPKPIIEHHEKIGVYEKNTDSPVGNKDRADRTPSRHVITEHFLRERQRTASRRTRYALAGVVFGVICCLVLVLLASKESTNSMTVSEVEQINSHETGRNIDKTTLESSHAITPSIPKFVTPTNNVTYGNISAEVASTEKVFALPATEQPAESSADTISGIMFDQPATQQETTPQAAMPVHDENPLQTQLDQQLAETRTQLDAMTQQYEQTRQNNEQLERAVRQNEAESMLRDAFALAESSPARGMILSLQAIERFQDLKLDVPNSARWTLNQSLASQNLGISLNGFQGGVKAMTLSRDGHWLLFADDTNTVMLWDVTKYDRESGCFPLDTTVRDGVSQLLMTSNVNWGICVRKNGALRIWDLKQANPSEKPINISDSRCLFTDAVVSEDGRWLAAYGKTDESRRDNANEVFLWDLNQLAQNGSLPSPIILKGHEKTIRSLAISRNSKWLVSGSEDRSVRVYDLKTAYPAAEQIVLKGHELAVNCVCVSPDGRWLVTGGRDSILRIWDMQNRQNEPTPIQLQEHEGWISAIAFSPNGRFLASGGYDNTIRLWRMNDTGRPEVVKVLSGHITPIKSVEFSRQGNRLVSLGIDHEVRLWDLTQGNPSENALKFRSPQVPISAAMLTGDDKWMVLSQERPNASSQSGLRLWPLQFEEAFDCAAGFASAKFPTQYQRRQNTVIPLPEYNEERIARISPSVPATTVTPLTSEPQSHEAISPQTSAIELYFPAGRR